MAHILKVLEERGLVDSTTSSDLWEMLERPCRFYIGFDPTAESLHVGNLVGIMVAAHFQRCGHTPVILVGGATARIGDPSGKSHERPLLDLSQVERNVTGIVRNLSLALDLNSPTAKPIFVNNADWYQPMGILDFLRDVGRSFRMGPLLGKEIVRKRLEGEEGLSYTEFSYSLLQAYDFLYLFDHLGVHLELGGSDQWGNITAGIELVRKQRGKEVYGLTFPLLTRSDGKKFGKSEQGAIWLSSEKLSPYDFYQYFVRIPDADVGKLLRCLTFLEISEIETLERGDPIEAQRALARAVTQIVHGIQGVEEAQAVTASIRPGHATDLSASNLEASGMPIVELPWNESLLDLLCMVGATSSKGEARRLIRNGGIRVNDQKIDDESAILALGDLIEGRLLVLGVGKSRKIVVRFKK
ncbi:MAG: tyrosine--tRNA ligase [Verrucomicrobia bacterium]|nr:tyrosine--tRNA ligase [Verrucomicrobiota bacterium]